MNLNPSTTKIIRRPNAITIKLVNNAANIQHKIPLTIILGPMLKSIWFQQYVVACFLYSWVAM